MSWFQHHFQWNSAQVSCCLCLSRWASVLTAVLLGFLVTSWPLLFWSSQRDRSACICQRCSIHLIQIISVLSFPQFLNQKPVWETSTNTMGIFHSTPRKCKTETIWIRNVPQICWSGTYFRTVSVPLTKPLTVPAASPVDTLPVRREKIRKSTSGHFGNSWWTECMDSYVIIGIRIVCFVFVFCSIDS